MQSHACNWSFHHPRLSLLNLGPVGDMDSCDDSSTDKKLDASETGNAGESEFHACSSSYEKMASLSKEIVEWIPKDVETLCKLCIELNEKGLARNEGDGWIVMINKYEKLIKKYDITQIKSKLTDLEEEWKKWKQLLYKETGLGWDPSKKTIDASDEWWEKKMQANPKLKPFRRKGIRPDLKVLLDRMFASGDIAETPAQSFTDEDIEATQLDRGDGTGSNGDNLECEIDEKIVELSEGKSRKRVAQSKVGRTQGKKEKKLTGAAKSTQQLEKICSAVESSSTAASQPNEVLGWTYKELMQLMDTVLEIQQDEQLKFSALDLFREMEDNREIFASLKSNERRVAWLKYEFKKLPLSCQPASLASPPLNQEDLRPPPSLRLSPACSTCSPRLRSVSFAIDFFDLLAKCLLWVGGG